jgi:hypothetical protein
MTRRPYRAPAVRLQPRIATQGHSLAPPELSTVLGPRLARGSPMLQTDMGGTVHMEDLWLVTANGCEPLNDTAHPYYHSVL